MLSLFIDCVTNANCSMIVCVTDAVEKFIGRQKPDRAKIAMTAGTSKVNPDLAQEREKASFNPTELTYLIYDGREKTERKRYLGESEN